MYLKIINIIFIVFISINSCYAINMSNYDILTLNNSISNLLKGTDWVFENSKINYFDIDGDSKNEIITFAYLPGKYITYVKILILKKNNNQVFIYMENPMIQPPISSTSSQYSEDYISIKDDGFEIHSIRGTSLRTSLISNFKVINGDLILTKQEVNSYRNTDGESFSRKYQFLTGDYIEISENILDQECRPNLTENGIFGSICKGDVGYTEKKEISSKKINKRILFSDLCSNFYNGINFSFSCNEKLYRVNDKSYLYKYPNFRTKLYLVKNDLINIIDKKVDDNKQTWYFINYKGKKQINMWLKADSVDLN
ncbi:hypothetical protein HYE53_00540 [Aggregatibacter actinomycetemcomitans]|uniref:hypothetical protein n=1 Tax=Aggregatibacter actinomycetemcomitans TaxID=714 RepID=UPI00197BF2DE|nr:hypothetical protein [Aggregatibacter actinomycetemcomitans]MBN6069653.1 hypothetical protein [Aggregatibacter actinomycetemcomitans]